MRTEDLLASCLETQAQGCSPAEWLAAQATPEQRAELEPLLALATRLRTLASPPLRPGVREAIAARLAGEPRRAPVHGSPALPDLGSPPQVHSRPAGPALAGWRLFFRGVKRAEHRGLLL